MMTPYFPLKILFLLVTVAEFAIVKFLQSFSKFLNIPESYKYFNNSQEYFYISMNCGIREKYTFTKEVLNSFLQRDASNTRSWGFLTAYIALVFVDARKKVFLFVFTVSSPKKVSISKSFQAKVFNLVFNLVFLLDIVLTSKALPFPGHFHLRALQVPQPCRQPCTLLCHITEPP